MSTKHIRCATDLGRFKALLKVTCGDCGNSRTLDAMEVVGLIGASAPLTDLQRRLKCLLCGAKAARVAILTPPPPRR